MGEGNDPSGAVTPEPPTPEKPTAWPIIGTIEGTSWGKDFDLTNTEGDIWKYEGLTVTDTDEFKIRANHDWGTSVGGAEENEDSGIDPVGNPYKVFRPTIGTAFAAGGLNIRIAVAGTYNVTFDYAAKTILIEAGSSAKATIADFAKEYVKILDVWEQNIGTVNRLTPWEVAKDTDEDVVKDVHYIPNTTTIKVGGKDYNIADMLETALRSYLLLRGWDGNETQKAGFGNFPAVTPVAMSTTDVPETHNFKFNKPLIESSNGGYLVKVEGDKEIHCQVDPVILDNWAQRSLNWPFNNDMLITNFCGYPRDPITNYKGCFSSGRALITFAFFFKYMLENQLDKADALGADVVIRSELFGDEGAPAGTKVIKTADELIAYLENPTEDAELGADINITGKQMLPAPEMTGNFDGKNHKITVSLGFPLFPLVRGDIKNLTIDGSFNATCGADKTVLAPIGKSYGTIQNVINRATVTLSGPAGQGGAETKNGAIAAGVVGEGYGPVKYCKNFGEISALASGKDTWAIFVGGVAGVVGDAVEGCVNNADVQLVAGSPLGRTKGLTEVSMKYDPVASVAGIVVYAVSDATHTVTVKDCENTGKISFTYDNLHDKSAAVSRSPVAGIVANSGGDITNCHNSGNIIAKMVASDRSKAYADINIILHAAGVQGSDYFVKKIKAAADQNETSVYNCSNSGDIIADSDMTKSNNTIGGVSAWPAAESASITVIKDCTNHGNLYVSGLLKIRAGGIAGGTNNIEGCKNTGSIFVESADKTSVFGLINGFHTQTHSLKNCETTGTLESKLAVSGLGGICGGIGNVENTICEGCKVYSNIIGGGTAQCGLIVGHLNGNTKNITIGTTESPVTVNGSVDGVTATADNYMTLLHKATNYTEGVHTFNAVFGN